MQASIQRIFESALRGVLEGEFAVEYALAGEESCA